MKAQDTIWTESSPTPNSRCRTCPNCRDTEPPPIGVVPQLMLAREDFSVRLACSDPQTMHQVDNLLARTYSYRGLQSPPPRPHANRDGEMVFAAAGAKGVFGTLTMGIDRSDGLLADELYREQIDDVRRMGGRACEITRFAIDACAPSRDVMASIFNVAFILAHAVFSVTDVFIEVHPRHAGFYRRLLGYRIAGPERTCPRVDAPAVLMHLRLEDVEHRVAQLHRGPHNDRSLYRLFMSPAEQTRALHAWTLPRRAHFARHNERREAFSSPRLGAYRKLTRASIRLDEAQSPMRL